MVIEKCRCFYKHGADKNCGCGFTDTPLQDDNEIHIKTATVNGVELLYVGKIATEDDDDLPIKSRFVLTMNLNKIKIKQFIIIYI